MAATSSPYFHLEADRGQPDPVTEVFYDFVSDMQEDGYTHDEIMAHWDRRQKQVARAACARQDFARTATGGF